VRRRYGRMRPAVRRPSVTALVILAELAALAVRIVAACSRRFSVSTDDVRKLGAALPPLRPDEAVMADG